MSWNRWSSVAEGSSMPGAPVTAVPYKSGFSLFLGDPSGGNLHDRMGPQSGYWVLA